MTHTTKRARVEAIDWSGVFPWLCLFRSFRSAIVPAQMLPALALVLLLYAGGMILDEMSVVQARTSDISAYDTHPQATPGLEADQPTGVIEAACRFKLNAIDRMAHAAVAMNFGFDELIDPNAAQELGRPDTVVSELRRLVVVLPTWLVNEHKWLMLIWVFAGLALWSLFGGLMARQAALDAGNARSADTAVTAPAQGAVAFTLSRFARFFITPLFPLIFAGILAVLLLLSRYVLFKWTGLDVVGGLLFFVALLLGFAIVMLLLLAAAGGSLLYPAIGVDDTDMFDAVSRALGYVLAKPWHWAFYTTVAVVYGAITYLFVGLVLEWTVATATHFTHDGEKLTGAADGLIWFWVALARSLLLAYLLSYYVTASTWIYLLLRRAQDGNQLDDVYQGQAEAETAFAGNSSD